MARQYRSSEQPNAGIPTLFRLDPSVKSLLSSMVGERFTANAIVNDAIIEYHRNHASELDISSSLTNYSNSLADVRETTVAALAGTPKKKGKK